MQKNLLSRKWLAVGIILLFIGVAVAPSINASTTKTIFENNNNVPLKTPQSDVKRTDSIKHPLLFIIVYSIYLSRILRGWTLYVNSWKDNGAWLPPSLIHPLLAIRGLWLVATVMYWCIFWNYISQSNGWNWPPILFEGFPNMIEKRG
jgi:hypothetical protein